MGIALSRRSMLAVAAGVAIAADAARARPIDGAVADTGFGPPPTEAHLVFNENPYGPSPSAIRAMAEVAAKGCYYVDNVEPRLVDLIARRFRVAPEQVVVGNGSSEVLAAAAMGWGAKGSIVTSELTFREALDYAEPKGVAVIKAPLGPDMGIDLGALADRVKPGVSLVHICNPNNPTAMLLDPASLRDFVRSVGPKATVLVDEAYNELTDRPDANSMIDLVRDGQNLIITRTFSKLYGMAGLRVGYAISTPENAARIRAYNMTIGLNSAGLAAALASYDDTTFTTYSRQRILEGRAMLLGAVKAAGLRALPSQANFVFVEVPDANALKTAMAARGIRIRGAYGRWSHWSRVSCGRIEHIHRYADALPRLVKA